MSQPSNTMTSDLTPFQLGCLNELKSWIQTEADFYGRSDDQFLLMHLISSKYNVDKIKIKLKIYYENRKQIPKWTANHNLDDIDFLTVLHQKMTIALPDVNDNEPTVAILKYGRVGDNSDYFDTIMRLQLIAYETMMRRENFQKNGVVWIIDCKDFPLWIVPKALNPFFIKDIVKCSIMSTTVKIRGVYVLNTPSVSVGVWALIRPFLPGKLQSRVQFFGSVWPTLHEQVAIETLPEEYGGEVGNIEHIEDEFIKEILSLRSYFADDNKYGFKK